MDDFSLDSTEVLAISPERLLIYVKIFFTLAFPLAILRDIAYDRCGFASTASQ